MSNFDKAIEIIMAEPPEPHYPAYYADLLSKADVPDKDVGECSETIYRQEAIDALRDKFKRTPTNAIRAMDAVKQLPPAEPRERLIAKIDVSEEQIRDVLEKMRNEPVQIMPSAQPERRKGKWIVDALANNIYRCSECGIDAPVEPTGGTEYKSNYCPNCGADMRGEQE